MVLRMEQGGLLQHPMPLHNDYGLPLEADCSDHCGSAHHDAYNNGGIEIIRRDSAINQHMPGPFSYAPAQATAGARFVTDRGVEAANSGSISTSPSSAASSLAYTNYPGQHYTNVQHLPGPVQLAQTFVPSTFTEARTSALLESNSHMLPPPQRPYSNVTDRDSFNAGSTPFLNRTQLSTPTFQSYTSQAYAETPRSVITGTAGLSLSPGTSPYSNVHMATAAAAQNYASTSNECAGFPWGDLEAPVEMTCDGQLVVPKIIAQVKGFFPDAEKRWTCYRRNYFSVTCNYELRPNFPNGRIEIRQGNSMQPVQAMGMRLSAAVYGGEGKTIELIQHTPKRDNGPKSKIEVTKIAPNPAISRVDSTMSPSGVYQMSMGSFHPSGQLPGPYLPLQGALDADAQAGASQSSQSSNQYPYTASTQPGLATGQATTHTFERVQFKQATANNGKRRATQQFFHLLIELFADVRKDSSASPEWVKVAHRVSTKIVVRGRSPSHYQGDKAEGGNICGKGVQVANSTGFGAVGSTSYASLNAGGFRSLPGVYNNGSGVGVRKEFYTDHGSQSDSSSSSLDDNTNPIDTGYPNDTMMSDAERIALHEHDGYQYYPSAMYEHVQGNTSLPPLAKLNGENGGYTGDSKMYAVKAEYSDAFANAQYQAAGCNRFQGVDTSRGYFPDLQRF